MDELDTLYHIKTFIKVVFSEISFVMTLCAVYNVDNVYILFAKLLTNRKHCKQCRIVDIVDKV